MSISKWKWVRWVPAANFAGSGSMVDASFVSLETLGI